MKRVLIFSVAYIPYVGGAELAIKEITDRVGDYEFDMITLRFDSKLPEVEKIGNVTVYRIGFTSTNVKVSDRALPWQCKLAKLFFPFTAFFKAFILDSKLRQGSALPHGYDLVWAMMANQAGFAALFFKLAHSEVPYFLELQDGTPLSQIKWRRPITTLLWPLYRAIYCQADVIKTISKFIKDLAREVGFTGRVEVIPNGVDVARFSAPIPEDELVEMKVRLGKKMGDIFLFTASRLVLSRGIEDIIRALPTLPQHVKLLVAGDGEGRSKIEEIAKGIGVRDRINFVGHIDHAALPRYFKAADIFVRPSIIEGMGSAFIEAFAAGVPVIATTVGGIPDFLSDPDRSPDDEPTGLFCNVHDPESIARAVKRYMEDPILTARIVKNARALAEEKYDWDLIARDVREKIFDGLSV